MTRTHRIPWPFKNGLPIARRSRICPAGGAGMRISRQPSTSASAVIRCGTRGAGGGTVTSRTEFVTPARVRIDPADVYGCGTTGVRVAAPTGLRACARRSAHARVSPGRPHARTS